ncbi:DEAD/DEAH box helicase [uncultured Varibaculum sp.]|uniref:DEAD/DEAH box helicase n=1 Tax=uncultured Varibaculum sp. TaxID=413896 RepID=UPI0027D930FC|nr:DEAD/DEAH box helicase [uncultured Varibaculum sp.]
MSIADLANGLRSFSSDQLLYETVLPARRPSFAPWPSWVGKDLPAGLKADGIERLWEHQVSCANALHSGRDVILTSGTGSGKSLAAWLPFLAQRHKSLLGVRPTALYLAPTKALARDQATALTHWANLAALDLQVAPVDGDSPAEVKKWARAGAEVVLTNPDFLHYALLPHNELWRPFLRGLSLVIVDEAHYYRGVLGANVALILRRLRRLARKYQAEPVFALLSATTANPEAHGANMLGRGRSLEVIDRDASACGARTVFVWRPPLIEDSDPASWEDENLWETSEGGGSFSSAAAGKEPKVTGGAADQSEAAAAEGPRYPAIWEGGRLLAQLVNSGGRVLTFAPSRQGVETIAQIARDQLSTRNPGLMSRVAAYRGGYLPEERRKLEKELRTGTLQGLSATSALELGIDISGLDATITCSWPGTRASFFQQLGRSGRSGQEGLGILVVSDNPLDDFLAHHPEEIFRSAEQIVFDTENPFVLAPQLLCAAAELPLTSEDTALFGEASAQIMTQLRQQGLLVDRPGGLCFDITKRFSPWQAVKLRGEGGQVQIIESESAQVIGTVDSSRADSVLHPDAIYVHQGRVWQVSRRDDDIAEVVPGPKKLRTRPNTDTSISITSEEAAPLTPAPTVSWHYGRIEVQTQVTSFDLLRLPGHVYQATFQLDCPTRTLQTTGTWFTLTEKLVKQLQLNEEQLLGGGLHAAEHALIGLLPLVATCDRWDLGGLSLTQHPQTGLPTVFIYDGTPGGAGFSRQGFRQLETWLDLTYRQVSACPCKQGCPRCIHSPKCGNGNEMLSKSAGRDLLEFLLSSFGSAGTAR